MSSALINALLGDIEVATIPSAITFLTALNTNKGNVAADALALAQLEGNLLADAPSVLNTVTAQLTAALIAKLTAIQAKPA